MLDALGRGRIIAVAVAAVALAAAFTLGPTLWGQLEPPLDVTDGTCEPGRVVRVSAGEDNALTPKIWEDWIVWPDWIRPADNPIGQQVDIYAYHIPTGEVHELATGPAHQTAPEIHHSTVIWTRETFDPPSLQLIHHDLETGESRPLNIPLNVTEAARGIFEPWVLVQGADDGGRELFAYNLDSEELRKVANYSVGVSEIWGDRIVWVEQNSKSPTGHDRLWLYNLTTGNASILLHDEEDWDLTDPDIYRDLVVYMKGSEPNLGDWDIYGYNMSTGEEFPVATNTSGPATQTDPRLAGDWVAYWQTMAREDAGVRAFHIPSGEAVQVAEGRGAGKQDVWRNRVVFTPDIPGGGQQIAVTCVSVPS